MKILGLDHLVLTVADVEATCRFYERVIGMKPVTFGEGRRALRFGEQKINLHPRDASFPLKAAHPTPGSADLCLLTSATPEEVVARLRECGVEILGGPVERTGATGSIVSVYFRDPDGNMIEVSAPPPDEEP